MSKKRDLFMVITLKNSGVQLRFPVNNYAINHDRLNKQFSGLEWSWDDEAPRVLRYIDPDEIAAVHSEWE